MRAVVSAHPAEKVSATSVSFYASVALNLMIPKLCFSQDVSVPCKALSYKLVNYFSPPFVCFCRSGLDG